MRAAPADALADLPVRELLDTLERPGTATAGGTAAALSAAAAASLVTMVARASPDWVESGGVAAQARRLRARLLTLAHSDAEAFSVALETLSRPDGADQWDRDANLASALDHAAELPLLIAEAAADVAELAALAAPNGEGRTRADAVVAAALAEAATSSAAGLVGTNLATRAGDERSQRAEAAVRAAARARALTAEAS